MIRHVVRIAAIILVAVACMFYPFLPGTHDRLAVPLSMMAQSLGLAGLLLVPIGVAWLIYEIVKRRARSRESESVSRIDKAFYFGLVALAASSVVAAAVALGAVTQTGLSLGVGVIMLWACLAWRGLRVLRSSKGRTVGAPGSSNFNPAPLYLILVPCILTLVQLAFINKAVEFSRNRAIAGCAGFINAIEVYRDRHGRYPLSLASELSDYDPPIIGVERYHYEPSGRAYNVFFEHFTVFPIGTREFVMYNPLGEQTFMVHDQDILESPPQQVDAERRYHVAHHARDVPPPAPPNWKRFWFD
jgi:hypothetical protein